MKKLLIPWMLTFMILALAGCGKEEEAQTGASWTAGENEEARPAMAVDVVTADYGKLVAQIEASGLVEGIQEAVVVSQTQGIIEEVYTDIGDPLEKGTPLLKVEDVILALSLEQAREQLENARITLEAQEKLKQSGGVSQADLLRSRSGFRGAQALYETALKAFEDTTLKSPIHGVLAWKASGLEVGNLVTPGQPLYRVADLAGIRVTLSVGERQVGLIAPGSLAEIRVPAALGSAPLEGSVKAVGAASDLTTGSYEVIVEAVEGRFDALRAGMTAVVTIETEDPRRGIIVPLSALVKRNEEDCLFIHRNGEVEARTVIVGESLGNRLIVLEGIDRGEEIIITGTGKLKGGESVTARKRSLFGG